MERLLWILLVTSATAWCIDLGLEAWNRYQTRPTVISLERNHWKWNTAFPAVTLCLNEIDSDRAEILISSFNFTNETEVEDFRNFITALATNVDNYLEWVLQASSTLDSPVEITQTFGELLEFKTILTEFGLCFAYNSRIAIYSTPGYLVKRDNKQVNLNNTILMINPSIPKPTLSITGLSSGYQIFFHGSYEMPQMSTKGMLVPAVTFSNFELLISSVQTAPEVKNLKLSQRNCRLTEESNLKHSPVYSYNLCQIECRRHLSIQLCGCIPYYYRNIQGDEKICDPLGMQCVYQNHNSIKLLFDGGVKMECPCMQTCDSDSIIISKYDVQAWFIGTNLKWMVAQYPTIRYKRTLIFSDINMLVQIGGVAGLFLGCSILSLIELFYYFTLRFYWGHSGNEMCQNAELFECCDTDNNIPIAKASLHVVEQENQTAILNETDSEFYDSDKDKDFIPDKITDSYSDNSSTEKHKRKLNLLEIKPDSVIVVAVEPNSVYKQLKK